MSIHPYATFSSERQSQRSSAILEGSDCSRDIKPQYLRPLRTKTICPIFSFRLPVKGNLLLVVLDDLLLLPVVGRVPSPAAIPHCGGVPLLALLDGMLLLVLLSASHPHGARQLDSSVEFIRGPTFSERALMFKHNAYPKMSGFIMCNCLDQEDILGDVSRLQQGASIRKSRSSSFSVL